MAEFNCKGEWDAIQAAGGNAHFNKRSCPMAWSSPPHRNPRHRASWVRVSVVRTEGGFFSGSRGAMTLWEYILAPSILSGV